MTQLVSVSALFDEPTAVPFLIEHVVPEMGTVVLYAASGVGKTHTVLDATLHAAIGREWMGHRVRQSRCVYIVGEGFSGIPARVRAWCTEHEVTPAELDPFFVVRRTALDVGDPVERDVLCEELREHGLDPDIVVTDTLSANAAPGFDESKTKDMKAFLDGARAIRDRLACTVVVVHHSGWDTSRYRGSSDLLGAVDVSLALRAEGEHVRVLTIEKARDFALPDPIRFKLSPKHGGVILEHIIGAAAGLTPAQRQCCSVLAEHGGQLKPSDWQRLTGHSRSYFNRLREELLRGGFVEKLGGEYALTAAGARMVAEFRASEDVPGDVPPLSPGTARSMSPLSPLSIDRGQGTSGDPAVEGDVSVRLPDGAVVTTRADDPDISRLGGVVIRQEAA